MLLWATSAPAEFVNTRRLLDCQVVTLALYPNSVPAPSPLVTCLPYVPFHVSDPLPLIF